MKWTGAVWLGLVVLACSSREHPTDAGTPGLPGTSALDAGRASTAQRDGSVTSATFADAGREIVAGRECPLRALPDDYKIVPGYACISRGAGTRVSDCIEDIQCMSPADCGPIQSSSCVGTASALCNYPVEVTACKTNEDCAALPDGICVLGGSIETLCYPSGECTDTQPLCRYPALNQACDTDAECTAAPGGYCDKVISHTHCQYDDCGHDTDCDGSQRCACASNLRLTCFEAECQGDADCGDGQRCRRGNPCGYGPYGDFYCTTDADECGGDADCIALGKLHCDFEASASRWQCNELICDPQ